MSITLKIILLLQCKSLCNILCSPIVHPCMSCHSILLCSVTSEPAQFTANLLGITVSCLFLPRNRHLLLAFENNCLVRTVTQTTVQPNKIQPWFGHGLVLCLVVGLDVFVVLVLCPEKKKEPTFQDLYDLYCCILSYTVIVRYKAIRITITV